MDGISVFRFHIGSGFFVFYSLLLLLCQKAQRTVGTGVPDGPDKVLNRTKHSLTDNKVDRRGRRSLQ